MIDIKSVIPLVLQKIEKLDVGGKVELKTYKRDRRVTVIKISIDSLHIIEKGFDNTEFQIPLSRLKRTLKSLLKKEFPRSNKVRLTVQVD